MEGFVGIFCNKKLIASGFLTEKKLKKMCRSKRKRIIKKWLKNPKNYIVVPQQKVYLTKDSVICHPDIADRILKSCGEASRDRIENHIINYFKF